MKKLLWLMLFPSMLLLCGCPGILVDQLEKADKEMTKQREKMPVYLNPSSTYTDVSHFEQLMNSYKADTTRFAMDTMSRDSLPVRKVERKGDTVSISISLPFGGKADVPVVDTSAKAGRKPAKAKQHEDYPVNFEIANIDDSDYPEEIRVRALVYDREGRYIYGLAPPYYKGDDWHKYWPKVEDSCLGEKAVIRGFSVEEIREGRGAPYALSFVLDHSPSMGQSRTLQLQKAVKVILYAIKEGDYVSAIKFTSDMFIEVPLTDDRQTYRTGFTVDGLSKKYGGGTAFYDGAIAGINEVAKAPASHRRVVILFSDGMDNTSKNNIDSLKIAAQREDVSIYTIAYGHAAEKPLRELAEFSGGRFYQIFSSNEFPYVFRDIYFSLNNYYLIKYAPPRCEDLHTVTAYLATPNAGITPIAASGEYDKSLFTRYDPVGTTAFVNIEFETGSAEIRDTSIYLVEKVARSMKNNPELKLRIAGHTDDVGTDEFNQELSEQRAKAVFDALVGMGIDPARLETVGYGESRPLAPNTSEANRRKNRRTELIIIR
ncbi:MAG: OmpA family protein [Candidatus Kapaibacterium sp.]